MITLGPLTFHLYGLLIGLGVFVGAVVASRVAQVKLDDVFDSLVWVVGFGLVGARLYHVVDLWSYYSVHVNEIVMVWRGGMGIFGGIVGGVLGAWFYSRKREERFLLFLDVGGLGLPIGQAIGRWGNYFNQELYGKPTNLPWGIFIKPENRLLDVIEFEKFHPLFLYESFGSVIIFLILWWLVKTKKVKVRKGKLFFWYLGLYGLVRFFLEFLKIEVWMINGVNVAQGVSLGLILLSLTVLKYNEIIPVDD